MRQIMAAVVALGLLIAADGVFNDFGVTNRFSVEIKRMARTTTQVIDRTVDFVRRQ